MTNRSCTVVRTRFDLYAFAKVRRQIMFRRSSFGPSQFGHLPYPSAGPQVEILKRRCALWTGYRMSDNCTNGASCLMPGRYMEWTYRRCTELYPAVTSARPLDLRIVVILILVKCHPCWPAPVIEAGQRKFESTEEFVQSTHRLSTGEGIETSISDYGTTKSVRECCLRARLTLHGRP